MGKYRIFEANMERLEKKLKRISNKCKKYGNDFQYKIVDEEWEEKKEVNKYGATYTKILHYIIVEAEGTAVINDWQFIATLNHEKQGNIIKKYPGCNVEIPERYYNCDPVCEHCNSNRYRKNTYIVQNINTGEFKQVGKSCLADFTHGLNAEYITQCISFYDELIQGESIDLDYDFIKENRYANIDTALCYIAETINKFGYVKSDLPGQRSTRQRALEYYLCNNNRNALIYEIRKVCEIEMENISFNAETDEIKSYIKNVKEWILNQDENNNYFHNLKIVCNAEYIKYDNFGILASVFPCYNRAMEKQKELEVIRKNDSGSVYVGNIGDRITIEIDFYKIVTSYETQWGVTGIYKIYGKDGNIYIWKTSKGIGDSRAKVTITGTIKEHKEWNGIKQTEITRCRVAYS